MKLSNVWNRLRGPKNVRQRVAIAPSAPAEVESFEARQLLSASALFIPATGELNIELNSNDNVRVSSVNGSVLIEVGANGGAYAPLTSIGTVASSSVLSLVVLGGDDANVIDLNSVTAAAFTALTSTSVDAANGNDTIVGSPDLRDNINGGHGEDTISGQGGNDSILGGDGNDVITGGTGDDTINSGDGNDSVDGNDGNDVVSLGNGQDTLNGGNGNDSCFAGNGQDLLNGDAGNDTLNGDGGTDTVNGGADNDSILGGEFADVLNGNDGNDTINGQSGNDSITGNVGDDSLVGGNGNDSLDGNAGNDTISGSAGNDTILGGNDDDLMFGGGGDDSLDGGAGADRGFGQAGNDTVLGQSGRDSLDGGAGNDLVITGPDSATALTAVAISAAQLTEGDAGTLQMVFFVQLSNANTLPITVDFATSNGTATAGSDYLAATGTVTFAPGQTLQQVNINIIGDVLTEADETFNVILSNAVNGSITTATGVGTIFDNELPPGGITVTDNNNANLLINALLGGNSAGLTVNSVTLQGQTDAATGAVSTGTFTVGNQLTYNLDRGGIVLSTGDAAAYGTGPNTNGSNTVPPGGFGTPATAAQNTVLTTITGVASHFDVTELSINFDLQPGFDTVFFELAFGSEEFPEFVGLIEDGFGIFVNGVNISQVNGLPINIDHPAMAAIPGTELDGVLAPNGNPHLLFSVTLGNGSTNNTLTFIIADALDAILDTTVYISSLGAADPNNPLPPPAPPVPTAPPPPAPGTEDDTGLGGTGDDTIIGGFGADQLNGNAGDDSILGGTANDLLLGGQGNDTLDGQAGDDTLDGQGGDDVLLGSDGNDTIATTGTGAGNDTVDGGDGFNGIVVNGNNSADTISITAPNGAITVTNSGATIEVGTNVQIVTVNGLIGDDLITIGDLSSADQTLVIVNGGDGNDTITGQGSAIGGVRLELNGNNGNDTIIGSEGADSINGGAGNDAINGRAGNDSINGGDGNDVLAGGADNDSIVGGAGNDFLTGQTGDDNMAGGDGNDTLRGFEGADTLQGQAGDDLLNGMDGDDSILGGVGKDQITGGSGNDTLDGGRNDDTINGNAGNDLIRGDHGNDYINAGTESDTVNGGDGNDTIIATDGGDLLNGGDGNDRINAGGGDDVISGGDGNDSILGGGGRDVILGGDGDDYIDGQGGTDTIAGNQGVDVIVDPAAEIDEMFVLSAELLTALEAVG